MLCQLILNISLIKNVGNHVENVQKSLNIKCFLFIRYYYIKSNIVE